MLGSGDHGSDFVCFDATQLIAFNNAEQLDILGAWFPRAFTPDVVTEEEIRPHLGKFPQGQRILDAAWLEPIPVESDAGIELVNYLLAERWKSAPDRDRGEAEVLALCRDHGWTAILDDEAGRVAARDIRIGVPSAMMLTTIIAAAAYELIKPNDAWALHVEVDQARKASFSKKGPGGSFSYLTSDTAHKPAFMQSVNAFRHVKQKQDLGWPQILTVPSLDELILHVRKYGYP